MLGSKLAVLSSFLFLGLGSQAVHADFAPGIIPTKAHTGYIPVGFDTNDNTQLVVEGTFSSTCYKPGPVDALVDHVKKEIRIQPRAFKYKGVCLPMLVNWSSEVDLGLLKTGDYKVIGDDRSGTTLPLGNMAVNAATTSEADDFPYAPVAQAYFDQAEGKSFVTISGDFPSSCYQMREVVTTVQKNVIVVQPITEKISEDCDARVVPYSQRVEVPNVSKGRYLIHVRSLNGKAMNNLVDAM
jgi:hypothetical protein